MLLQIVLQQQRRRRGIQILGSQPRSLGARVALVVQLDLETGVHARGGEPARTSGLEPFLAAQRQRQPDHDPACLLSPRDARHRLDVACQIVPSDGLERARDAEGVVRDGDADPAVADVEGKITRQRTPPGT